MRRRCPNHTGFSTSSWSLAERRQRVGTGRRRPSGGDELATFLDRFGPFLGSDRRHEFWIKAGEGPDLLVYDPHEIVFAYGDLDRFERALLAEGYVPGEVSIPVPHMHYYHAENDADTESLLASRLWTYFALTADDEGRAEESRLLEGADTLKAEPWEDCAWS